MEKKICSKCKIEKDICEFGKDKHNIDGLTYQCKTCKKLNTKKWIENNPSKYSESKIKNRENIKNWTTLNPEKNREKNKKWEKNNQNKIKNKSKNFKEKNPEYYKKYYKKWLDNNPDYFKNYIKDRKENDDIFKIIMNIRSRLSTFLKVKKTHKDYEFVKILGCSSEEFKIYIQSKFTEGMSWDNYGLYGWHIDHIIPLSSSKTTEDVLILSHYTNLQPLWAKDNLKKGYKIL
jgi:hypothetical protein